MQTVLYNPFEDCRFDNNTCFLSGEPLQSAEEQIPVFQDWLMRKFDIGDKPFKLLDESFRTYKQLRLPCTTAVAERFSELDRHVERAFEGGCEAVMGMDKVTLFPWVASMRSEERRVGTECFSTWNTQGVPSHEIQK